MSMMVSFVLSFFPRDVLDEILNLIESVSEGFPSYSYYHAKIIIQILINSLMILKVLKVRHTVVYLKLRTEKNNYFSSCSKF